MKKISLPKVKKIKFSQCLKLLPDMTILILIIFFCLTIAFLYEYFYQTIAQAKVVNILRNQVALSQINTPLYQKVLNAWDAKKQFDSSSLENIKDPFQPLILVSTTQEAGPTLEQANNP